MMAKKKNEKTSPFVPVEEQPYQVPENWCWVTVNAINHYSGGAVNPMTMLNDTFELYSVPSSANDYPEIVTGAEIGSTKQAVMEGDVLLCKINPRINRVWLVSKYTENILLASSEWIVVRNEQLDSRYLMYCFKTQFFREYMLSNVSGVGGSLMRAQPKHVKQYPVPVPPLSEQQRIVARIESLFAKLDEAKEKLQEALESFETRKKSLMYRAFRGELTSRWRKSHGISDEWKALTLNDVAEYKKGPFGSSITKAMFVPKGANTYKVYEQGNAIRKTLNYGHYYITESKYVELKGFAVNPGDIIISCAGTIGEIYKLPENCEAGVINQALMRVRLYPCITDNYFIYYFSANIRADVEDNAKGTAIKNIPPFKVMKAMDIMLPSVQEQNEIVRILDDFLAKEVETKAKVEATLEAIGTMKKSILAKAFRGELGTNNPEDESAEELLK